MGLIETVPRGYATTIKTGGRLVPRTRAFRGMLTKTARTCNMCSFDLLAYNKTALPLVFPKVASCDTWPELKEKVLNILGNFDQRFLDVEGNSMFEPQDGDY